MDVIWLRGLLAFTSRFKQLSDRSMKDTFRIYWEQGLDLEPCWFIVFCLRSLKFHLAIERSQE